MGNLYEHKNSRRSAKANGLTTQSDKKSIIETKSGVQKPLKKRGVFRKAL